MTHKEFPKEFIQATPVIEKIEDAGFSAYFVGGSVRDYLLGKEISDVDIATSAYPSEIKSLFSHTFDVGIEHGTVLVLQDAEQYEITTFRTESKYTDYRRPDKVEFVRSLEEDLKRRDFTINALALQTNGEMIDLFEGQKDLSKKLIRAVGNPNDRFNEDALRMMRAFRFQAQLDFSIEEATFLAICDNAEKLEKIAIERILVELAKLMKSPTKVESLRNFVKSNCASYLPKLTQENFEQITATLAEKEMLATYSYQENEEFWTIFAFILDFDEKRLAELMKSWKESNKAIAAAKKLLRGLRLRRTNEWERLTIYPFTKEEVTWIEEMLARFQMQHDKPKAMELFESLTIHDRKEIEMNGNEILKQTGLTPGTWLGEMIAEIEKEIVQGKLLNTKVAIGEFVAQKKG